VSARARQRQYSAKACARLDEEAEGQPLRLLRIPEPRSEQLSHSPGEWPRGRQTQRTTANQRQPPSAGLRAVRRSPAGERFQRSGGAPVAGATERTGPARLSCGAGERPGGRRFHRSRRRGFSPPGSESTASAAGRGGDERLLSAGAGPEYISQGRDGRNNWAGLERFQRSEGGSVAGAAKRTGTAHAFRAGPWSDPVWAGTVGAVFSRGQRGAGSFGAGVGQSRSDAQVSEHISQGGLWANQPGGAERHRGRANPPERVAGVLSPCERINRQHGGARRSRAAFESPTRPRIYLPRVETDETIGLERIQRRGGGSVAWATERTGPAHVFRAGPGSDSVWAGWGFSAGTVGGGGYLRRGAHQPERV
jgi:hypothetical protein